MKAANSYASLLRGVSQQVPQERAEGQHTEQVNMLSDPVNGLTRRHGSVLQAERDLPALAAAEFSSYMADVATWRSYDFSTGGKEYVVLHRKEQRPVSAHPLPVALVYNKTDARFLNYNRPPVDADLDLLEAGGVSAMVGVGRYLFMASNSLATSGSSVNKWDTVDNLANAVVWIRGGAYSRTFKVTVRLQNGSSTTVAYTTPTSSYQGVLDTSDIVYTAPDYTKQVKDRVNAYNRAVTAWIGSSTAAIQPTAIAEQLLLLLNAAGYTATRVGSHICFSPAIGVKVIEADDGGDGAFIRAVADEVESADKVSAIHAVGKVVKVRSKESQDAYYLKAIPKDATVTAGYTEVTWAESAGVEHSITGGLFYATISGNNFFIASSAALLATIIAGDHPTFLTSTSGDHDTSPMPFWVGRKVTYLGTFQNRLLVGSGGALAVSQTDEYLNFFRNTVLTLPADSPFEMFPQGSEDDELFHSALYDQDLVIFGKDRQYLISGTVALSPTSANMPVMASYEGAADAPPTAAGGFIFFAKRGEQYSSVFQIQPGLNEKSPDAFPASSQIDRYIVGGAVELLSATGTPSLIFLRTASSQNSLYVFAYLDKQDGRKMDSWSRWDFNPVLGPIVGMSNDSDGILTVSLRLSGSTVYIAADHCPTLTGLSSKPYLDSQREWAEVSAGTGSVTPSSGEEWGVAFDSRNTKRLSGALMPDVTDFLAAHPTTTGLVAGAIQDAFLIPTNPFMRDGKDKVILSGRLTVSRVTVAFKETSGFTWELSYKDTVLTEVRFNGRILGEPEDFIGIEPITTGQHNIPICRETRQYELTLRARSWFPLTLTAMEWTGQFFNRVQRF